MFRISIKCGDVIRIQQFKNDSANVLLAPITSKFAPKNPLQKTLTLQKAHGQDAPRARPTNPIERITNGASRNVLDGHEYFDRHHTSDASAI